MSHNAVRANESHSKRASKPSSKRYREYPLELQRQTLERLEELYGDNTDYDASYLFEAHTIFIMKATMYKCGVPVKYLDYIDSPRVVVNLVLPE